MKLVLVTIQLFFKQPAVKTGQLLILTNRVKKLITHLVIACQREILAAEISLILHAGRPACSRRSIEYIVFLRLPQIQVIDHMIPGLQIFFRSTLIVADPFIDLVRKEVCTVLAFLKITAVITE